MKSFWGGALRASRQSKTRGNKQTLPEAICPATAVVGPYIHAPTASYMYTPLKSQRGGEASTGMHAIIMFGALEALDRGFPFRVSATGLKARFRNRFLRTFSVVHSKPTVHEVLNIVFILQKQHSYVYQTSAWYVGSMYEPTDVYLVLDTVPNFAIHRNIERSTYLSYRISHPITVYDNHHKFLISGSDYEHKVPGI